MPSRRWRELTAASRRREISEIFELGRAPGSRQQDLRFRSKGNFRALSEYRIERFEIDTAVNDCIRC